MITTLIDTDPGIDDALALLLAWGSPALDVVAVTTVAGNVPLDRATTNVLRLLALRRPARPPALASGAARPLRRPLTVATKYHGIDGLGDLADWPAVDGSTVRPDAAALLVDLARHHGPALTVIALGPLTNVALALEADAAALASIGRLIVMGGAVDVPGNVTADAEFNMHVDPEAAARVFAARLPIDVVPLDATRQAVLTRRDLEAALHGCRDTLAERILRFTERGFRVDAARGTAGMVLHDPLAVGVALGDFVEWERVRLAIGSDGETRRAAGAPNCRKAGRVRTDAFLALLLERLCPGSS